MKVTVNNTKDKPKMVAFVRHSGLLVMRNRDDDKNTVLNVDGEVCSGSLKFEEYFNHNLDTPIYEGDSITIQF